jgi:hypothetical protein
MVKGPAIQPANAVKRLRTAYADPIRMDGDQREASKSVYDLMTWQAHNLGAVAE